MRTGPIARPHSRRSTVLLSAVLGASLMGPLSLSSPAHAVSPPAPAAARGFLTAVAAIAADDVWAVGTTNGLRTYDTLVRHWDGSAWSTVPSPSPSDKNILNSISATTATDIWAVGSDATDGLHRQHTLVEHWDGSVWTQVASPDPPGPRGSSLFAVSADSSSDAWAVGVVGDDTLVEHWDGVGWKRVPSPSGARGGSLYGVSAMSPQDVWAVGVASPDNAVAGRTLVEHWDGSTWRRVPSPSPGGATGNTLSDVAAISSIDVWAVGGFVDAGATKTLVEHWNGSDWTHVRSPNPQQGIEISLSGVSAAGPDDVWAVGSSYAPSGAYQTLVEHWDGSAWRHVDSPNQGRGSQLVDVAAIAGDDAWTVGVSFARSGGDLTLSEHWNGSAWSIP